jgi:hypothetical protein
MTKFAAYDSASIYAISDTPESAIAKAREDAGDSTAEFETAPIGAELAAWIDENGWNGAHRSFRLAYGRIVDTTDLSFDIGERVISVATPGLVAEEDAGETGAVLEIVGDRVLVAWESGVQTWTPIETIEEE